MSNADAGSRISDIFMQVLDGRAVAQTGLDP